MKILSSLEVSVLKEQKTEVNSWIGSVKEYLIDVNGQLMTAKQSIFFIDSQVFLTNTNPQRPISVMVRRTSFIISRKQQIKMVVHKYLTHFYEIYFAIVFFL